MAKKIDGYIKLEIPAGKANPSPPVGPALGQRGVNIMEFCKAFNAATQQSEPGVPTPVIITVYADRSFTFITKTPPTSYFLKRAAKLQKARAQPAGPLQLRKSPKLRCAKSPRRNCPTSIVRPLSRRCYRSKDPPVHGLAGGGVRSWQKSESV